MFVLVRHDNNDSAIHMRTIERFRNSRSYWSNISVDVLNMIVCIFMMLVERTTTESELVNKKMTLFVDFVFF
jgi:hypothetical protein